MGAIFPMAPHKVREGLLKKREKEARRSAEQASIVAVSSGAPQGLSPLPDKLPPNPLERHNRRRKRKAKQKAEARRLKEDMAVSAAVKDLLKTIRDSVGTIARIPKDERGRMHAYDVTEDGEEIPFFEKTSQIFKRFTSKERRALLVITRKYRAAAKRLTTSVAAAEGLWDATLADYNGDELKRSATKSGGHL
jgi:hypothetical protein